MASQKANSFWDLRNQVFAAIAASMSFYVTGEVRGWASPAVPSFQGFDGLNNSFSYAPLSKEECSWIISGPPIGAIPAALVSSILLQWLGRKKTLLLSFLLFLVTFTVMGTGSIHESYAAVLISRSCTGVAVGFCMPAAQIYIAECSCPSIRGILSSLPAMFMAFGISATYLIGAFVPWDWLSYICAVAPLIGFLAMFLIPESPVWLNNKGKTKEAIQSATWLKNETAMSNIDLAKDRVDQTDINEPSELWSKKTLIPFAISMTLMIFQQWSGVNTVIFNTVTIFTAARVPIDEHVASNMVGVVQLLATALSLVVIDKAGRRVLLVVSGIVMFLSLSVIGAYFYVIYEIDSSMEQELSWLPLASLITFMIGYSIGFATVPFILMGELLPARYRNLLGGIASSFNLLNTFMVLKLFPTLEMNVEYYGVFWIYAANCLVGSAFVYFVLPETKGKTLAEIEKHFAS